MLPYSEKTNQVEFAIQSLSGAQMLALKKLLKGEEINTLEKTQLDRILFAIENPTFLKSKK